VIGDAKLVQQLAMGCIVQGSKPSKIFLHLSTPAPRNTQAPVQWVPSLFSRKAQLRHVVDDPSSSTAKDKERVKLYLYSYSGSS